jgi:hypothetical protein
LEVRARVERAAKHRRRNMLFLFAITTLYLPLSSLALDALFWGDTFWPIDNPYKEVDPVTGKKIDEPNFDALARGPGYRDPRDFCYVTSMKEDDFNFAYIIIPLAVLTLIGLGGYFPYALMRLIRKHQPKVDRYGEDGQLLENYREEYRRKLEMDPSPYNFLYNGKCR